MEIRGSGYGTLAVCLALITLLLLTSQEWGRARNIYLVHDTGLYLRAGLELAQGTNGSFTGEL